MSLISKTFTPDSIFDRDSREEPFTCIIRIRTESKKVKIMKTFCGSADADNF